MKGKTGPPKGSPEFLGKCFICGGYVTVKIGRTGNLVRSHRCSQPARPTSPTKGEETGLNRKGAGTSPATGGSGVVFTATMCRNCSCSVTRHGTFNQRPCLTHAHEYCEKYEALGREMAKKLNAVKEIP